MNGLTTTAEKSGENSGSLIDRWAKMLFVRFMNHIEHGQLKIYDGDEEITLGTAGDLSAHVTVHDQRFYSKMILGGSVGAGEAYIDRYWDTNDLVAVIQVFARNHPIGQTASACFGLTSVVALWLAFPPPRPYRRRLANLPDRGSGRGA